MIFFILKRWKSNCGRWRRVQVAGRFFPEPGDTLFTEKEKPTSRRRALWSDLTPLEWMVRKMGNNLQMQTDNWLVSRELSEAAGPWDSRLWKNNDGEYFCRVVMVSDHIGFVPDAKSYYRAAGFKSVTHICGSNKKLESLFLSMKLHIHYLRSMEDSDRTRLACMNYIRTRVPEFYPYRPDLVEKLKRIILELGGRFEEPRLSRKYDWIAKSFGWRLGWQAYHQLPKLRASLVIGWDKVMSRLRVDPASVREREGQHNTSTKRSNAREAIACSLRNCRSSEVFHWSQKSKALGNFGTKGTLVAFMAWLVVGRVCGAARDCCILVRRLSISRRDTPREYKRSRG